MGLTLKIAPKTLLDIINTFSKEAGYKINETINL
jgi:hypothetical protein